MGNERLGRKQKISNDAWLNAMKHIEELVPKSELDERVGQTVKDIMATTNGKKAAVAWSGGKDSLVLADVCRQAGIEDSVLVVSNLEYSAFTEWVDRNKPPKLEIINTGQDIEWLVKHPQMLFPQDSNTAAQWFHIVQHRGQAKYYKAHELDMILLGRRRADGNYIGKGSNIYTDGKGVTRFSPLADWSHEEVLAYKNDITKYVLVGLKDSEGNGNYYIYNEGDNSYTLYRELHFNKLNIVIKDYNGKIPDKYKKTVIAINEEEVAAYKLKEASDYALIYGMNTDTGEENLYIYDRVEHTILRYNDEEANIYKKLANNYFLYLICLVIGLSLGILVITIISILRHKKKNKFKLYS